MEAKRYTVGINTLVPYRRCDTGPFYLTDDPAVVQAFRMAELYDKGDSEWWALEAKLRETIKTLTEQCVKHAEEAQKYLRNSDALMKLAEIINRVEWVKLSIESTGVEIDAVGGGSAPAYVRRFKLAAPTLLTAIESIKEG